MMKYAVNFQVDVSTAQKAVSLRDGARDYITQNGGTITNYSSSRVESDWHVYGARMSGGSIVPVDGVFVAETQAEAEAKALVAGGPTTVVVYSVQER
jgi:hypothetical protein